MSPKTEPRVDQKRLAAELGVTDRRIRQLVEELILPPPDLDDGHDLALCRERYELYREGTDRDWADFMDCAEVGSKEAAALFKRALSDQATLADVKKASAAVQQDTARLHFLTACRSKSQEEKKLFHQLWDQQDDARLAQLISKTVEVMGATHIRNETTGALIPVIIGAHHDGDGPAARKRRPKAA